MIHVCVPELLGIVRAVYTASAHLIYHHSASLLLLFSFFEHNPTAAAAEKIIIPYQRLNKASTVYMFYAISLGRRMLLRIHIKYNRERAMEWDRNTVKVRDTQRDPIYLFFIQFPDNFSPSVVERVCVQIWCASVSHLEIRINGIFFFYLPFANGI